MPPLATTLRGCCKPVNQCTVSIWWLIHWPGSRKNRARTSGTLDISLDQRRHRGDSIKTASSRYLLLLVWQQVRPAPAAGLVYIPCQFHHSYRTKLAGLDKVVRCMVIGTAPPLRADLHNMVGSFNGFQGSTVVVHSFGKGLFDDMHRSRLSRLLWHVKHVENRQC